MDQCLHGMDEGTCSLCSGPKKAAVAPPVEQVPYVPPKKRGRKAWYGSVYLRSDHWQAVRQRTLKNKTWKCYGCGDPNGPFDVHHRRYRLYAEKATDLVLVCRPCHVGIHELREQENISVWRATKLWRTAKRHSTYDPHLAMEKRKAKERRSGGAPYSKGVKRARKAGVVGSMNIVGGKKARTTPRGPGTPGAGRWTEAAG